MFHSNIDYNNNIKNKVGEILTMNYKKIKRLPLCVVFFGDVRVADLDGCGQHLSFLWIGSYLKHHGKALG
jgi:hypothetical protein